MFGRSRSTPAALIKAPPPWQGEVMRAEWARLPVKRRRDVPSVVIVCGDLRVQLHAVEVTKLVRRRIGIAESVDVPLAFLCWPETAAPSSLAEEVVGKLPKQSLALLVEADGLALAAVVTGADLESFTAWALELPR